MSWETVTKILEEVNKLANPSAKELQVSGAWVLLGQLLLNSWCRGGTWTVYTVHCTLYTVHCTLYTVHCTLYTVHCTLYTALWIFSPLHSALQYCSELCRYFTTLHTQVLYYSTIHCTTLHTAHPGTVLQYYPSTVFQYYPGTVLHYYPGTIFQ